MNTVEKNEMLADYMGYEGQFEEWCGSNVLGDDIFSETGKSIMPFNPESNWHWLMPIAAKAYNEGNQIEQDKKGDTETTYARRDLGAFIARLIQGLLEFDIEICYNAVVGIITKIRSINGYYENNPSN